MVNKIKSIKRTKTNSKNKNEPASQTASPKKNPGKTKKSNEVEALALTWNEDLCE